LLSFITQCGYLGCSAPEKQTPKNHDSCILVAVANAMATNSVKPAHSAILRFPKRKLSPLRRACLSLGLPVDARPHTNLARRQIVELYYSLKNATERKAVTIDYLIMAAGADVHHVSGLIQEGLSRATECEATLLVCTNGPDVTRKAIEHALTPEGHEDRELVLRIAEVVPAPTQTRLTVGLHRRGI
jgi:hypothetical protein